MSKNTLKCKSATLTPNGGISTVWEDSRDTTTKYEIVIDPDAMERFINCYDCEEEGEDKVK